MVGRKSSSKTSVLYNIFLLLSSALCHMEMSWPYPLRSKYNPANSYSIIDYSMTNPLEDTGSQFPCKGYQNDRPIQTTISYEAGSTYNMSLTGSATHEGGSCQLSLSYDNGATFRVIKSIIGGCPLQTTYNFTIPWYAPSGTALFAWTWQNLVGNREYYMNCAEVDISASSTGKLRRQSETSFDQLPFLWKANLGDPNCTTYEGQTVVYPHPGPDVQYGTGYDSTASPSPGDCDEPTPYGATYEDLGDSSLPPASVVPPSYSSTDTSSTIVTPSSTTTQTYAPSTLSYSESQSSSTDSNIHQRPPLTASQSYSTTTITADCPETVTVTISPSISPTITVTSMPSHYTTVAPQSACTGTSASCPCAQDYQCQELSPCTWACNAYTSPTTLATSRRSPEPSTSADEDDNSETRTTSTLQVTSTHSVVPIRSSSSRAPSRTSPLGSNPSGSSQNHPPYASGDVNRYLPCVPGTFICLDSSTWDTCNYNDDSLEGASSDSWVYGYPRNVSDGMECITFLSPYSSETNQYSQQALTPNGYYRDDRIVRARPHGDCDDDGALQCTDGGQMFDICDQGGWVLMGSVANGTTCRDGQIVAS